MPKHTPAKRAQNRRQALKVAQKKLGATFTAKEGAALKKLEAELGKSKATNKQILLRRKTALTAREAARIKVREARRRK